MAISLSEYQALIPLASLSGVYWLRDRYRFNRARGATSTAQWSVLFVLSPLWVFLEWTSGLQVSRRNWWLIGTATIGRTLVGHYATVVILNDGYVQTRQQVFSFLVTLLITYMWAILSVLMFAHDDAPRCVCANTTA